ncbi:MAG TPA: DHCW motif cupin fold protein, partial [Terriglobales bacterium]
MAPLPMSIIDWLEIPATEHPGESGFAWWRTQMFGDVRVRMVEYSPGYLADHWCSKGHVIL